MQSLELFILENWTNSQTCCYVGFPVRLKNMSNKSLGKVTGREIALIGFLAALAKCCETCKLLEDFILEISLLYLSDSQRIVR